MVIVSTRLERECNMKKFSKRLGLILAVIAFSIINYGTVYAADYKKACIQYINVPKDATTLGNFYVADYITNCTGVTIPNSTSVKLSLVSSKYLNKINNDTIQFKNLNMLTGTDSQSIHLKYNYNNTNYDYDISFTLTKSTSGNEVCCQMADGTKKFVTSCSGQNKKLDASSCGVNVKTEDNEICYEFKTANSTKRFWKKPSEVASDSRYQTNDTLKQYTKSQCLNNTVDTNEEDVRVSEYVTTTSSTSTGKNSCTSFKVQRIASYKTRTNSQFKIDNKGSETGYNVYQTTYTCSGADTTPVTAFCIDPGAHGVQTYWDKTKGLSASNSHTVNYTSNKITPDRNSKFWRAIYRLYANWYVDDTNRAKIENGAGSVTKEHYLDFVINNVARVIVAQYGKGYVTLNNPGTNNTELNRAYQFYKEFGNGKFSGVYAANILNEVLDDVRKFANSSEEIPSSASEVDFVLEAEKPTLIESNTGFEAKFKVKLKSENESVLQEALNSFNITLQTESGTQIALTSDEIKKTSDWQAEDGYQVASFVVTKKNVYSSLGEDDILNLRVNINYESKKSFDNILLLTTTTPGPTTKYQKFLTFTHGKVAKTEEISIDMGKKKSNACRASYAMPCISNESVFYLIEGTQSSSLLNNVMAGIKNIGDLRNLISNSLNLVEVLKDGFSNINISDLKNTSSFLYNIADNIGITKNLKNDLSFLKTLSERQTNRNVTAGNLYNLLTQLDFSSTVNNNYKNFVNFITASVLNSLQENGFDKTVKEWKEILTAASESNVSTATRTLLENIYNCITSTGSASSLKDVMSAATKLASELAKGTGMDEIMSNILSFASTMQTVVTGTGDGLNGVISYLNNIKEQALSATNLGDGNIGNLVNSLKESLTVNWEKCIIGEGNTEATDPKGNSYTVQTANNYCKIVCKEDYAVKMPGNLGTAYAGRYISTNLDNIYHATIGMAGQRTCVTTSIDNETYLSDATKDKEAMLTAYNNYLNYYASFRGLESETPGKEDAAKDPTPFDTGSAKLAIESQLNSSLSTIINSFVSNVVGSATSADFMKIRSNFSNKMADFGTGILNFAGAGKLNAGSIMNLFGSTAQSAFGDVYEQYKDKISTALDNVKDTVVTEVGKIADTALKETGKTALDALGKGAITVVCQLSRLVELNELCGIYAQGSTKFSDAITTIGKSTKGTLNIFQRTASVPYTYKHAVYKLEDTSDQEHKLSSKFVFDNEKQESANSGLDDKEVWIMTDGSYTFNSLHFGFYINLESLQSAFDSFNSLYESGLNVAESITNTFGALKDAKEIVNDPSLGSIKALTGGSFSDLLNIENINSILGTLNTIFTKLSGATGSVSSVEKDLSNMLDDALDGYYYLRGAFDTYYNSLATLRKGMKDEKNKYEIYRSSLNQKASNMNACTIWNQEYQMDPDITFTYGYKNNNLLDYIAAKSDKTTDRIKLKAINKPESPTVSTYYCYKDVNINEIQDWNKILDGTCVTSDGVLGRILGALSGNNSLVGNVATWFNNNKEGLKQLLSSVQNVPGVSEFTSSICSNNNALCDLFGISSDSDEEDVSGSVKTYIPGSIVYDFSNINNYKNMFSDASSALASGNFKGLEQSIVQNLNPKQQDGYTVKYRNVKRVATISRYGNPGVAISGLNIQSLLSNIATYFSSKFGGTTNDVLSTINKFVTGVNGQGAQEFIYYESSVDYWTYGNKGIYVKADAAKNITDSILADSGDEALTNDAIKTADGSSKTPNGYIYPIALSTKEGTYTYQININNVGQYYNNTASLGRIIDSSGYVNGLLANEYVCKYEVKSSPCDPTVEECDNKPTCKTIYNSDLCKDSSGYFQNQYLQNKNYNAEQKWSACLTKLLENKCCDLVTDSSSVPDSKKEDYNQVCANKGLCKGFKIYNYTTSDGSSKNDPNAALITKNGTLNFTTKVVSNNNMFPNGDASKSFNYKGTTSGYENKDENGKPQPQEISKIIEQWEEKGDSIYDADADFSIDLNAACIAKIKSYNDEQEKIDLGFGDYTLGSISKESREYKSKFLQDLRENPGTCVIKEKTTN